MHTHTLLIADDSITTQRVIQLTFSNETIRVVVASDGHQALERIEAERPDIILACTSMPGVDGYAIARHVSRKRHLRKIPVLLLQNGFEPDDEQKVKASGAKAVLQKPLDPGVVIHSVKYELGLQAALGERASDAPKPRRARPSSPRPRSTRRRSAVAPAQQVSTRAAQSSSRPRPSARRKRGKGLTEFQAAYGPIAALNTENVPAGAITVEMLTQNVSEAVGQAVGQAIAHAITHAIAGFQRAQGPAPEPAIEANVGSVVLNAANPLKSRSADGPMVVHGDTTVLHQLRRDMGIDDLLVDDALFPAAGPGIHGPVDAVALASKVAVSPALIEREPADVLSDWSEDLKWLAVEIGTVRVAPATVAPDSPRDFGTGWDTRPPQTVIARVGAWLAASDIRRRITNVGADAIAWIRSGTAQLGDPFRGGQVRVPTWALLMAGASALLKGISKGY